MTLKTFATVTLAWFMLFLITGCTFQVGVDWRGETAVENKTYTDKKK